MGFGFCLTFQHFSGAHMVTPLVNLGVTKPEPQTYYSPPILSRFSMCLLTAVIESQQCCPNSESSVNYVMKMEETKGLHFLYITGRLIRSIFRSKHLSIISDLMIRRSHAKGHAFLFALVQLTCILCIVEHVCACASSGRRCEF